MRAAAAVLASLIALATVLGMLACFFAAIWTYGPDSARLAGTGVLLMFTSIPTVALAVFAVGSALDA